MLTDLQIRQLPATGKRYKKHDGAGLYLLVLGNGTKTWRWKFKRDGREQGPLALGEWPGVSLAQARKQRDRLRAEVLLGKNPALERRAARATQKEQAIEQKNTFGAAAKDWLAQMKPRVEKSTHEQREGRVNNYLLASLERADGEKLKPLGDMPIRDIRKKHVVSVLLAIQERGLGDTVYRVRTLIHQIFEWAVACDRAEMNPATGTELAVTPKPTKNFACAKTRDDIREVLQTTWDYHGMLSVRQAMRVMPYVAARPVEIRNWRWRDIDTENAVWRRKLAKRKKGEPPKVMLCPLPPQVMTEVELLRPFSGQSPENHIFFGKVKGKPISEATINVALRRLGIDTQELHTGHGWRGSFSTVARESGAPSAWSEAQLGHVVQDNTEAAYNHAEYLVQRRRIMQWWADWLDAARLDEPAPELVNYFSAREFGLATGSIVPLALATFSE